MGSVHDACMFRRSPLHQKLEQNSATVMNGNHILGDLAYPLRLDVIVPYKNTGRLTRKQEKFNNSLSAARSSIERAFSLLKGRWRRLKYLDMTMLAKIPYVIVACCVLHNICIGTLDDILDIDESEDGDGNSLPEISSSCLRTAEQALAVIKRDKICDDISACR